MTKSEYAKIIIILFRQREYKLALNMMIAHGITPNKIKQDPDYDQPEYFPF